MSPSSMYAYVDQHQQTAQTVSSSVGQSVRFVSERSRIDSRCEHFNQCNNLVLFFADYQSQILATVHLNPISWPFFYPFRPLFKLDAVRLSQSFSLAFLPRRPPRAPPHPRRSSFANVTGGGLRKLLFRF